MVIMPPCQGGNTGSIPVTCSNIRREITEGEASTIREGRFYGFEPMDPAHIEASKHWITYGVGSAEGIELHVNESMYASERELVEEALAISRTLDLMLTFRGERKGFGVGTFYIFSSDDIPYGTLTHFPSQLRRNHQKAHQHLLARQDNTQRHQRLVEMSLHQQLLEL